VSQQPPRDQEEFKTPFSFKLMVVLTVLYLGWRLVQGIAWVIRQLG
jgi:hypothetical protein